MLRAARRQLEEYERNRQNHENLLGQLNALTAGQKTPSKITGGHHIALVALLGLTGAAFIVAGWLLGENALMLGIGGGLILLIAAGVLWLMGRSPSLPMASALELQTANAETVVEAARQPLLESAATLGIDSQPDALALDLVEARLEADRNALDDWNAVNSRIAATVKQEKLQEQRVQSAKHERETAQSAAQGAEQEWRAWLRERGLDETLTADTMIAFLARVEVLRASLSEINGMRQRVTAIEHDIEEFREQVEPLAIRHGLHLNADDQRQLARVADELISRLDRAQTAVSQREQASIQEQETRQLLERRGRHLESVEEQLVELLAAGGTNDAETFRRRASQHDERLMLERQRDEHRHSLERISGPGERFDAFREAFERADLEYLKEEEARLLELHDELDHERNRLREERGGIDKELSQLNDEAESSTLRLRKYTLEEQLREHAREWSRLTIAEALLEKTRQKFERERQPGVIRHAQEFFSRVTSHRYRRLYAPIGEQTITVTDATGRSKRPKELSRGTREQLYLALRFGLIREFGEHAERLPVVVDEALVNFDSERARLAAEAFAKLAETNQVLVFTCHPAIAELFADAAGAGVVDITR